MKILFYLSFPFISAFIGWLTNVVGIKLIFRPRSPYKLGPITFQGILPKYRVKFANALAVLTKQEVISGAQLFERVDVEEVQSILRPILEDLAKDYMKIALDEINPALWNILPVKVKRNFISGLQKDTLEAVHEILKDLKANIDELFDLKEFIFNVLTSDQGELLEHIFLTVGGEPFRFIERIGGYFGFIMGIVQLLLWVITGEWFILPLVGCLIGLIANWLAILLCFEPHELKEMGGFKYQGQVPKKQSAISRLYGERMAELVLRPDLMLNAFFSGSAGKAIISHINRKVDLVMNERMGMLKPMGYIVASETLRTIKEKIVDRAIASFADISDELHYYIRQTTRVEELLESKLVSLPKERFEKLLRGLFREDEMLLVLYGGAIGTIIGLLQLIMLLLV